MTASIGLPQSQSPAAGAVSGGQAWLTATLLFIFTIVNFADKVVVGLVAVPMMKELGLTPTEFGLIGSSFFWLFAITGIAGGFLADRWPAKWLLLGMSVIWALVQLPMYFGSTLAVFIVARVLLGAGEGPAWPVALHAVYKWFPDRKRNLPVALLSQGGAIGLLLAGLTIPLVTKNYGWRAAFVGLAVIGVVWSVLWLLVGREGPIDVRNEAPMSANEAKAPLGRVLADPTVWGNFVMHFVAYWSLAGALTWLPAYLEKGLGMSGVVAGRNYGLIVAVTIPLVLLASWLSQRMLARGQSSRVARGRFSAVALLLSGVLFSLFVLDMPVGARVGVFALALGLTPTIYALGPAMLAQVAPPSRRGAVLAIDNSIASLAGVIAPAVFGMVIQRMPGEHGYEVGFLVTGVLLVLGAVIGWLTVDPERSIARNQR